MRQEDLKSLLERAYEEGWRGCLEMKGAVAAKLAKEHLPDSAFNGQSSFTIATADYENVVNPYYFYSTMTAPPEEVVRRDEVP